MVNIVFRGKSIKYLEAEAIEKFKRSCDRNQITYIEDIQHDSLILAPDLEGKTIVIRLLSNEQELLGLAESLKKELLLNGATIIIDEQAEVKKGVLKLSDEQIVLFISESSDANAGEVVFYSSIFDANHYDGIVKHLFKHFVEDSSGISFNVAGILQKLTNKRYWPYLFSATASNLLIAFGNTETVAALREKLPKWLAESFIHAYGRSHCFEEYCIIDKILDEVIDTITVEKQENAEKKQMDDVGSSLKQVLESIKSVSQQVAVLSPEKTDSPAAEPVPKKEAQNPQISTKLRKENPRSKVHNRAMILSPHMSRYPFIPPSDGPVYRFAHGSAPDNVPFVPAETPSLTSLSCKQQGFFSRSIAQPAQKIKIDADGAGVKSLDILHSIKKIEETEDD